MGFFGAFWFLPYKNLIRKSIGNFSSALYLFANSALYMFANSVI